jgi:hypothetical protein
MREYIQKRSTIFLFHVIFYYLYLISFAGEVQKMASSSPFPEKVLRTITVGGSEADISGFTSKAIQTAVDALLLHGGGIIKLYPGTFEIMAPVHLYSTMELIGSGTETVLHKVDGSRTNFIVDADYGEKKLTVEDPSGFDLDMGVQISDSVNNNAWAVSTSIITKIEGNVIYIKDYLLRDYRADRKGVISNSCSVVSAVECENIRIADFTIDGNKATNDVINGCRGGCIYLHKVKNVLVEDVIIKDFSGDGISWQITENVTVQNCEVSECRKGGLHPGTGSYKTVIERNNIHNNERDGLYVCWRVQNGIVKDNKFHHNGRYGLCTGHKDTDMIFENNYINNNGKSGVFFRKESALNAPHGNVFRNNIIEDNGIKVKGYGLSFNSPVEGTLLEGNIIRDTGKGTQQAAVYLYSKDLSIDLRKNRISGHEKGDVVIGDLE